MNDPHCSQDGDRDRERADLLARAVDGELSPAQRAEVERRVRDDAEFRSALEAERAAAEHADAWAGGWRLPGTGLEEDVLRKMGITPRVSWPKRLVWIAGAAAAVLVFVVWGQTEQARPTRTLAERSTATFTPDGSGRSSAEALGGGAYRVEEGASRVHADEPTLLETPAGVVELAPGDYDVEVVGDRVSVSVVAGEAVLRLPGGARRVIGKGRSGSFTRSKSGVVARAEPGGGGEKRHARVDEDVPAVATRAVTIVGRVTDSSGSVVEGARATVDGKEQAVADAGGNFRIEGSFRVGAQLSVVAAGYAPSDARVLDLDRPAYELAIVMRNKGGALKLSVVDGADKPIAGARVRVGGNYWNVPTRTRSAEGLRLTRAPEFSFVTSGAGLVEGEGLAPEWNRLIVEAEGFAPHSGWIRLPPSMRTAEVIKLRRGVVVFGTVLDAGGRGVAEVRLGVRQAGSGVIVDGIETKTDASGRFRLVNVPARKSEVFALDEAGRTVSTWVRGKPGEEIRWDAVLEEAGVVSGVVQYDDGSAVEGARVWCRRALRGSGDAPMRLRTDANGRFEWRKRPNALHEVSVWYPGASAAQMAPPALQVRYLPDESPKTITLARRDAEPDPGHIEGVLVEPGGAAAAGARVRAWPEGRPGWPLSALTASDGSFKLGPMQPGKYHCELHKDGHPTLHLRDVVVGIGARKDLGNVALPRPGFVKGRIIYQGKPWAKGRVFVVSLDGRIYYTTRREEDAQGPYDITEGLAPGRYLVRGGAPGLEKVVDVREGETTEAALELGAGGNARIEFVRADGTALREVRYEVLAASGRVVYSGTLDLGESQVTFWAIEGAYRVQATDDRGKTGEAEFTVTAAKDLKPTATPRVLLR